MGEAQAGATIGRRVLRRGRTLGTLLVIAGLAVLVWTFVVWRFEDPFTGLYGAYRQHQLASEYEERLRSLPPAPRRGAILLAEMRAELAAEATRYRQTLPHGDPVGRIIVPRLGLRAIVVNGSDTESLRRGPGRDERTFAPGEGELVYVAAHRTTYTAPFSHIERLRRGDLVVIEVPYATFRYRISSHEVVPKDALGRLRSRGAEQLTLQASHPRFFSSHRYLAHALPDRVRPRGATRFYDLWPNAGPTRGSAGRRP